MKISRFAEEARRQFAFLSDSGFSEVEFGDTLVRYANGRLEVSVYYGRQSHEIGFEISRDGLRYTVRELIHASDPEAAKGYRNYAANSNESIVEGLRKLSSVVQVYGASVLANDDRVFRALRDNQKQQAEQYEFSVRARQIRPMATMAFHRGDFAEAYRLYGEIHSALTPSELKKFEISRARSRVTG